jgi:hypothetical protein
MAYRVGSLRREPVWLVALIFDFGAHGLNLRGWAGSGSQLSHRFKLDRDPGHCLGRVRFFKCLDSSKTILPCTFLTLQY